MILTSSVVSNAAKSECTVCLNAESLVCDEHAKLQMDETQTSFSNMILLLREEASFIFKNDFQETNYCNQLFFFSTFMVNML